MKRTQEKWEIITDSNGWLSFESTKTGEIIMRFEEPANRSAGTIPPGNIDAHLIAAAPELLKACKDISDLAELWLDDSDDPPFREGAGFNAAIQCKVYGIKQAIAKAEQA